MRTVLFAHGPVGYQIVKFFLKEHHNDLRMLVTVDENYIYELGVENGIEVFLYDEAEQRLLAEDVVFDLGFLAWWPKILKAPLLNKAQLGFINTHPSLLPYGRGKFPAFWAIYEGTPYGVSLHMVDEGIDTGDLIATKKIPYDLCDTGRTLYDKSLTAIVDLVKETYPIIGENVRELSVKQPAEVGSFHYARDIEPVTRIDVNKEYLASELISLMRARNFGEDFPACSIDVGGEIYHVRLSITKAPEQNEL